jgi:mannose-6-phosphate isomerase
VRAAAAVARGLCGGASFLWGGGTEVPVTSRVARRIVEKPWGREVFIAETPYYVAKIVYMDRNTTMSKHYHEQRYETLHFLTPECTLEVDRGPGQRETVSPDVGESFTIEPGVTHRIMSGPLGARILEVSTPQPEDVVRVEDPWKAKRLVQEQEARQKAGPGAAPRP